MGRTRQERVRIEHRRMQVSELYLKGWTQAAIARELGVSQATISSDLKAIRAEWKQSQTRNLDEVVEEQLKKLQLPIREAWAAWERSQQPVETTQLTQKNGEKKVVKTVRQGPGDPRLLQIVLSAIERCGKLLGLDEAASTLLERPEAQLPTIPWDMLAEGGSKDSDVIEDKIEPCLAEPSKSRTDATSKPEAPEEYTGTAI